MSHVFISYSKKDRDYARKLDEQLKREGFEVWFDDRIPYGQDWERTIFKKIDECAAFIVLMSPQSDASDWVRLECHHAQKRKKEVFPILLEGEEFSRYGLTQYADVRGEKPLSMDFFDRLGSFALRNLSAVPTDITVHPLTLTLNATINDPSILAEQSPLIPSARGSLLIQDSSKFDDEGLGTETASIFEMPDLSNILPPPFDWCYIPAGNVTLNTGKSYTVPEFAMAKYAITNAQYQVFLEANDGYDAWDWWSYSEQVQTLHLENPNPKTTAFVGDNLPRTNICWYEAVAFCMWLNTKISNGLPKTNSNEVK